MPVVSGPALAHRQAMAETLSLCKEFVPPFALRQSGAKNPSVKAFQTLNVTQMCHSAYVFATFPIRQTPTITTNF
jgi:hypothetical protein